MSQPCGLREHPSDVQRRDGDDPELHASDADDQLRQVARREMKLLRPSGITCETHHRDIGNPGMKMPRGRAGFRAHPRFGWGRFRTTSSRPESGKARNGVDTFKSRQPERSEAPGPRGRGRMLGLGRLASSRGHRGNTTVKTDKYPAAVLLLTLAAAILIPFVFGPVGVARAGMGSVGPASDRASSAAHTAGDVVANSNPRVVRNATNLIADGTFDAIPGPWNYTNGTTGAVTASRDPTARARLGHTEPVLRFDSMDDVFGMTPWTSMVSNPQSASNLSQETAIRKEGNGSLHDDVTIAQNNQWAGAIRNDPLPWNWSGYNRLAIWMDRATPSALTAWVFVQDQVGGISLGQYALVAGWYRYPLDLNAPLDVSQVDYLAVIFTGAGGTTGIVYVDDVVLFNSTVFAESARVAQTFTKSTPTGGSPNSLRLFFDLQATLSLDVVADLEVMVGNTVEWSESPVASGARTIDLDLSGDSGLQAAGSFTLVFSLRLNRTGSEESSMTAWIDNVTVFIPGTLARISVTPTTASVLVGQTAVFTAEGWDTDDNPVALTATNWSATIGQLVAFNATSATFHAQTLPGTGVVTVAQGTVRGSANVTVDPTTAAVPPSPPWYTALWPGMALLAAALAVAGFVVLRRSVNHAFHIEDLFLINREGLLIAHTTSRRDAHGDADILAGMLTAIMSFAQDVFQEEIGGLRQFEIGNMTVALERSEHVYVAAIGSGPIRNRFSASLRDFLVDIEERYGNRLQWWSGMNGLRTFTRSDTRPSTTAA